VIFMEKKQKIGIIAFIILLFLAGLSVIYPNRVYFLRMFSDLLTLNQLFLILLYAVIPCVPAVIIRAVFGFRSLKWIALAATVICGLCCVTNIFLPETVLYGKIALSSYASGFKMSYANEWIFIFTQFALISSVPVLYCVAFAGDLYNPLSVIKRRSILIIIAPALMFFLSLFMRKLFINGILDAFLSVFTGEMIRLLILSAIYVVWALLLTFISRMIYRQIKKYELDKKFTDNPKVKKYAAIVSAVILIPVLMLAVFVYKSGGDKLVKTYNETYDRYEFSYKKSVLVIRKEIFDEYKLTDSNIQKFFDGCEIVYKKLADFFPKHDFPKSVIYHAVPKQWSSESGYEYYGDKIDFNMWADPWTNETFYEESLFAQYLSMIDAGFPAIACHEIGHLFNVSADEEYQYYNQPYVWDSELFADLAEYYIASEIPVINAAGETVKKGEWDDLYYSKFFGLVDKYGYKTISETLKKVNNASPDINGSDIHPLALFIKFLSQKTGDDIEPIEFISNPNRHKCISGID